MYVRYSTVFSHLVLGATSCYCLQHVGMKVVGFPQVAYGIMALNSIVGIIIWGYDRHGESCARFYRFTSFLQSILALPCVTTSVWLKLNVYRWEAAYAHTFVSIIPLISYFNDDFHSRDQVHAITVVNMVSLGIVSGMAKNWFGVGAAVAYAAAHFGIKEDERDWAGIPAFDCYNFVLAVFAFVSARALGAV